MTKLTWDNVGERFFETGVDRGVLYVGTVGVPWNGLIRINETPTGGNAKPYYIDGTKFYNTTDLEEFEASIEAYTYPEIFSECDGTGFDGNGIYFGNQPRKPFGLAYRTRIGNDVAGTELGYKIHLIYNALAKPTQKNNSTNTNIASLITFNWGITTTPVAISGRVPTAHLIIDSTKTKSDALREVEELLYGTSTQQPTLPTPSELITLLSDWDAFEIVPQTTTGITTLDPIGPDDLEGNTDIGIFVADADTRLIPTAIPGLNSLDS